MHPSLQYYIIHTLQHALSKPQVFFDKIIDNVIKNYKNFLECSHFLNLYIETYRKDEINLREIFYWK